MLARTVDYTQDEVGKRAARSFSVTQAFPAVAVTSLSLRNTLPHFDNLGRSDPIQWSPMRSRMRCMACDRNIRFNGLMLPCLGQTFVCSPSGVRGSAEVCHSPGNIHCLNGDPHIAGMKGVARPEEYPSGISRYFRRTKKSKKGFSFHLKDPSNAWNISGRKYSSLALFKISSA